MTDDEAVERARLCTYDDLRRWWTAESAKQRAEALRVTRENCRNVPEGMREFILSEVEKALDEKIAEGFEALDRERGITLDAPTVQ